ncbi:hypothetical protein Ancab_023878 [Ancistrocladus abbreviatus]
MTDNDIMINGVNDVPSEFDDFTSKKSGATVTDDDGSRVDHLNHRIEELEREKRESAEGMKRMEAQIEELMTQNAAMQEHRSCNCDCVLGVGEHAPRCFLAHSKGCSKG